jgi:3-methyladenine DNA glycosylase AlkD
MTWNWSSSDFGAGPDDFGMGGNEILRSITVLTSRLAHARDPEYEEKIRRATSNQPAHGVRAPKVKGIVKEWLRERKGMPDDFTFTVCDGLWSTGWREERLAAISIVIHSDLLYGMDWADLDRWSREIDNPELVDALAGITGRMLQMNPRLHANVRNMSNSANPWQRRLAVVTLIVAAHDSAWEPGLAAMVERLQNDDEPQVKRAVDWARERLRRLTARRAGAR